MGRQFDSSIAGIEGQAGQDADAPAKDATVGMTLSMARRSEYVCAPSRGRWGRPAC